MIRLDGSATADFAAASAPVFSIPGFDAARNETACACGDADARPAPIRVEADVDADADGQPDASFGAGPGDVDLMLCAARNRLVRTVGEGFARLGQTGGGRVAAGLPGDVLECLEDLGRLCATVADEAGRDRRRAIELQHALAALRAAEQAAQHRALRDELTGLLNGASFRAGLGRALGDRNGSPAPVALLCLDLDEFRAVNVRLGEEAGDALLKVVGGRLKAALRADDQACRLGSDEFAYLLTGVADRQEITRFVWQLFDAIAGPAQIGKVGLSIEASIGVALYPADGTTAGALLRSADVAMYRAKRLKSGHAFFDQRCELGPRD